MLFPSFPRRCVIVLCLVLGPVFAPAVPVVLDIQSYRTPVSPGTVDEDLMILRDLVPELTRRIFPVSPKRDRSGPDTIELRLSRAPKPLPGTGFQSGSRVVVNGNRYQQTTEKYLKWRKEYETNWIQSQVSSWEPKAAPKTPLQMIFEDQGLNQRSKAMAMLRIYLEDSTQAEAHLASTPRPTPTPPPDFWPVSRIIDMPEVNASVQINMRGGKVTVLDGATEQATVIPFDASQDPRLWLANFQNQARLHGLAQAVKMEQEKAALTTRKKAPRPPLPIAPPEPVINLPEEKPKPQIPWGE